MVTGIDKFREHFVAHEGQYAIIGGAACDLLFDAAGLDFRATRDIDLVLCVEVLDAEFARAFKTFLDSGGYQARERSDGRREFYRFHRPTDASFPYMIELFSRRPDNLNLPEGAVVASIPVEEDIASLSAILLEESYFDALQVAKRQIDGVTIIDETLLIPFKARAVLDLTARLETTGEVDRRNIRKHLNDVFRLVQLLTHDTSVELGEPMRRDLLSFVSLVQADKTLNPRTFGVPFSRDDAVDLLRSVYSLA